MQASDRQEIDALLRALGEGPVLRELENAGLGPANRRCRCPYEGCKDKGPKRSKSAAIYASHGHTRVKCFACGVGGDLLDLLQALHGWSIGQALEHLRGTPAPAPGKTPLRIVPTTPAVDDRMPPAEVRRLWDGLVKNDPLGEEYLGKRGLQDAVQLGLVKFATEGHSDKGVSYSGKTGYRIAVLMNDVTGNSRGIQFRLARDASTRKGEKEAKVKSVKGSATGKSFFGSPELIESAAVVCVAEGLPDFLALSGWAQDDKETVVVGAAGKGNLPNLANELFEAGIPLDGKTFVLFPQNDRPKNESRREFVRLSQLLTKRNAHCILVATDVEHKDVADWTKAEPEMPWPPREVASAFACEEAEDTAANMVLPDGCATAIDLDCRAEFYAQDLRTLKTLLMDSVHREAIMGRGELRKDEMLGSVTYGGRPITSSDVTNIRTRIEAHGRSTDGKPLKFSTQEVVDMLDMLSSVKPPEHAVRTWLKSLTWDGLPRLKSGLSKALGVEPESLASILLAKWAISAVARVMHPGCKVDTMLVLVGPQGIGKSRFFRALAGEWFTDSPVNVGDKDGMMILRRSWIIEWAELDSMRRARDMEATKAFLSSCEDTFRPPYGKDTITAKRSSVIVGTTNNAEFLFDTTGNRRFWPVKVKSIDIAWVKENREQIFAEALTLYRSEETWWLSQEEGEELISAHEEHTTQDLWLAPFLKYLKGHNGEPHICLEDVLEGAVGVKPEHQHAPEEKRGGTIMRQLGCTAGRITMEGHKVRVWYLPENLPTEMELPF